jgi:hypothetical protein
MLEWIGTIWDWVTSGLPDLVRDIIRKIQGVWTIITGFFTVLGGIVTHIRLTILGWITATEAWLAATLTTMRWIITTFVPALIAQAVDALRKAFGVAITVVRQALTQAIDDLRRWALARLGDLWTGITGLAAWAKDRIGVLWNDVGRLKDHVFGVLATAERLVAWILSPLISAVQRWVLDNAERLARAAFSNMAKIALEGASLIEGIVARII